MNQSYRSIMEENVIVDDHPISKRSINNKIPVPVDSDVNLLQQVTNVLSILSKNDALTIFLLSKDRLESELETPYKIGLTKKQYYTRLKQLVDLGLLSKQENAYTHTAFGTLVYQKHILGLMSHLKNSKYLEMIDILKTTSKFDNEEIMEFLSKVNAGSNIELGNVNSTKQRIIVISSFDDLVTEVLQDVGFAKKEVLLISRFPNDLIINSLMQKANTGVIVKSIADVEMVRDYFEEEKCKIDTEDKNKTERIKVVSNPFYLSKVERRYAHVKFSVLVFDSKRVGIEIVDSYNPKKFKMAIFVDDEHLSTQMKDLFNNLWKDANPNLPQIATNSRT